MNTGRAQILAGAFAAMLVVVAIAVYVARSEPTVAPTTTTPTTPSPSPSPAPVAIDAGAVTTKTVTVLRAEPRLEAREIGRLRPGILLPVMGQAGGFLAVLTPCEARGWVSPADVVAHARAVATPRSLTEATIVIDPGHGGQLDGAVGPTGLREKDPNAEIATRLAAKLENTRVFVTHAGDVTAGLGYRAAIANALGANILVSVHNNSDPDGPSSRPGTETYYQYRSAASKRLAGLIYEELVPVLDRYNALWVADRDAGAKYRLNSRGSDYYALLRGTHVPAVIVESLFVSNASEEALLRRADVADAIANGIAAGIDRYFTTEDPGSGFVVPYPREPGPSGTLPAICNDPAP